MDLELGVVAVVDVLGGLDGTVVVESDVVVGLLLGGEDEVATVLVDDELAPLSTLSGGQLTALVDTEVTAGVGDVLELDVLGLVSGVQAVDLPGGGVTVATSGADLVAIELQVLAGGNVLEVDFTVVLEGSEDHVDYVFSSEMKE